MKTIGKVKINKNEPTVDFREGGFTKQGGGSLSFCNVFYFGTCLSSIVITQFYSINAKVVYFWARGGGG